MRVVVSITIAPRIVVTRYVRKIMLRWYLTQLQNKINTVTIISAHIPHELSSSGIRTMYKHTRILHIKQQPRLQFMKYLKICIHTLQKNEDLIILRMDFNNPIERHNHTVFFDEVFLHEMIISIHIGNSPPSTNLMNESYYTIY